MGIISRLLLFLYVIAVLVAVIVCGGICLHIIPTKLWQDVLKEIIERQETLAVLGAMLAASFCLLCVVFSGKKKSGGRKSDDVELKKGEAGEVLVAVEAVTSVVEQAALTVSGVREVHAEIFQNSEAVPIKIRLSIVLSQGYSAPKVSEEINSAVSEATKTAFEISEVPIELKVREITHAVVDREKRVV